MKISANRESAEALRGFAKAIPRAVSGLHESTSELVNGFIAVSDTLGEHAEDFREIFLQVASFEDTVEDSISILQSGLLQTAEKIDQYLNRLNNANKQQGVIGEIGNGNHYRTWSGNTFKSEKESPKASAINHDGGPEQMSVAELPGMRILKNAQKEQEFYVAGKHFNSFLRYYEARSSGKVRKLDSLNSRFVFVRARDIEGVTLSEREAFGSSFWSRQDGQSLQTAIDKIKCLPEIRRRMGNGDSISDLVADQVLGDAAGTFFNFPIKVDQVDDFFVFAGDGRHRIISAQYQDAYIPVIIRSVYTS